MDQAEEIIGVILVADDEAAEVLEPGKETFDLPAAAVTAKGSSILSFDAAIATVRGNELDAEGGEFAVQAIGVISGVAN